MRFAVYLVLIACSQWTVASQTVVADAEQQLEQLFRDSWEFTLREDPLFATSYGDHRWDDKLPEMSLADLERRHQVDREFLKRLEAIDRKKLSTASQFNYDIFARIKRDEVAEGEFLTYLMPITNRSGFHTSFPELPEDLPLLTVKDYENYIAQLNAFGRFADQHIQVMREGVKRGFTLPIVVLRDFDKPISTHIVTDPAQSLLFKPFVKPPATFSAVERKRLAEAGRKAIEESVVPGYRRFLDFMTREYVPASRDQIGASALPRGRELYRHRVRHHTTLDITPQEVHETGLAEVKRIKAEMHDVIKQVGFQGDFAAFTQHLRTDPKFYVDTPERLMMEVGYKLKLIDGQLPKLFGKLPRTPYGIREIPPYIAPGTTTAYYSPPAGDGTRAGFYYVNTYDLKSRPLFEVEALSLHEAVPGHHLQIALAQELEGLPPFRRFAGFNAFVEGWGLYSERLGLEMGFYQDPYSNFGRLSYEMWRACRLVVDTGMHYMGWTRQQAIDFMAANTALTLHNINAEVDRYISWPGQAVAYKTGELKIRALRKLAENELGAKFDVRKFHDVVLGSGAIPLDLLEANVKEFIQRQKQSG